LGSGDTIIITFDVDTSQPTVSSKTYIDALINFGQKPFGMDYSGAWTDAKILVLTVIDATYGDLAVGDTLIIKDNGNLKMADKLSLASTSSGVIGGSFGDAGIIVRFTDANLEAAVRAA